MSLRKVPRPFDLHWGKGVIAEEASVVTPFHDRLRARDARLGGHKDDLARVVRSDFDEGVHLAVDAAAGSLLIRAAILVGQPLRGPVVSETVDLSHVFRRDHASNLEPLAGRSSGE